MASSAYISRLFCQYCLVLLAAVVVGLLAQSVVPPVQSTTDSVSQGQISAWDKFLAFPPEYVALLGLGIAFFLLFIIVIIIVCMTGRGGKN